MRPQFFVLIVSAVLILLNAGCSRQNRTGDPGVDGSELGRQFEAALSQVGNLSVDGLDASAELRRLFDDRDATVFHATSAGSLGSPAAVLALYDFGFLDPALNSVQQITEANVFLIDLFAADQSRTMALLIDVSYSVGGQSKREVRPFVQVSDTVIERNFLATTLKDDKNNELIVSTRDLDNDSSQLKSVIQLNLELVDPASGLKRQIGRIPSLFGFSG
jgi:co-chaperonin GroES (HSP10)